MLDTNVISEVRRPRPEPQVLRFLAAQPSHTLFLSEVSLAEIRYGIEIAKSAIKRAELSDWLTHKSRPQFENRILSVNEDVLLKWRLLVEAGRKLRITYSQPDLLLAATALHHELTVVSRDVSEFERAGALVFNPWN